MVADKLQPLLWDFYSLNITVKKTTLKRRDENRIELLQWTLDLLILQTLQWGAQHGYAISQVIRAGSGEVLQVDTGSLQESGFFIEYQYST